MVSAAFNSCGEMLSMYGNETSSVALVSWKRVAVSAEPSWSVIVSFVCSVIARRLFFFAVRA